MENKLSSFEIDNMWMSYRYCIGRHTISSQSHASDIAQNLYDKLSYDELMFASQDICKEIAYVLQVSYNYYMKIEYETNNYKPLDLFIEFINSNIDFSGSFEEKLNKILNKNSNKNTEYSLNTLDDLIVWQLLANLFDVSSHCKTEDGVEYFYGYLKSYSNPVAYKRYKIVVNDIYKKPLELCNNIE